MILPDDEYQRRNPVAFALRKQGFVPLPRFWVRQEDILKILEITDSCRDEVNEIRGNVYRMLGVKGLKPGGAQPIVEGSDETSNQDKSDPKHSIDAAWAAYEAILKGGVT